MKALCAGMMVCDFFVSSVPFDIMRKDSVNINKPALACGGDALNVAISLSRLGVDVAIAGRIADDTNGQFLLSECEVNAIDTSSVEFDDQFSTAMTIVLIDTNGERHFLTNNEIFAKFEIDDINKDLIRKVDYVYFGSAMSFPLMDDGGIASLFKYAHSLGKTTIMDAAINESNQAENWLDRLSPALHQTDIFFPSLCEAKLITKKEEPNEIAECFSQFGMKAFGVKLGSQGCYVTDFQKEEKIPGFKDIPVIDTTGAGDSFMAGLICSLTKNLDIFKSAEIANAIAALNVGKIGGSSGVPDFEKACQFLKNKKGK